MLFLLSKTFRRIVAALLLTVLVVVGGTAARVWWVARSDARPTSDAIVVLGASQFDGRPSRVLAHGSTMRRPCSRRASRPG